MINLMYSFLILMMMMMTDESNSSKGYNYISNTVRKTVELKGK